MLRWDEVEQRRISEQHRSSHAFDDDDSGDNESVLSDDGAHRVHSSVSLCSNSARIRGPVALGPCLMKLSDDLS